MKAIPVRWTYVRQPIPGPGQRRIIAPVLAAFGSYLLHHIVIAVGLVKVSFRFEPIEVALVMNKLPIQKFSRVAFGAGVVGAAILSGQTPAVAHVGHIGELAGHGHLVGIALTGAAIALAGWLIKDSANTEEAETSDEEMNQGLQGDGSQTETGDEVHA